MKGHCIVNYIYLKCIYGVWNLLIEMINTNIDKEILE